MDAFTKALLKGYVKSITFESNVNPPITIDEPFADKPPGISDKAIAALQPKVTIKVWDQEPLVIAPAGEPSSVKREIGLGTAFAIGVGSSLLAAWIFSKRK